MIYDSMTFVFHVFVLSRSLSLSLFFQKHFVFWNDLSGFLHGFWGAAGRLLVVNDSLIIMDSVCCLVWKLRVPVCFLVVLVFSFSKQWRHQLTLWDSNVRKTIP